MTNALLVGTVVSALAGLVGVFVVMRGQAFAGHILTDVGAAGASGSLLAGVNAWYGFVSFGLLAGTGVEVFGNRARSRDAGTGIVLSFAMGLEALFLFLVTRYTNNAGATMLILFGSLFTADPSLTPVVVGVALFMVALLLFIYRPLLLCTVNPEIAQARGVRVRLIGVLFMLLMVLAVENASIVAGALLATALLIGPAAAAMRLTTRTSLALLLAAGIGVTVTGLGILLAYESYYWPPTGRGWPVGFFISALIFLIYLAVGFGRSSAGAGRSSAGAGHRPQKGA